MTQKIIIDADPGIGDALAVLVAMADPAIEVIGLTATAGAVSGVQATRNLQYLINERIPSSIHELASRIWWTHPAMKLQPGCRTCST